MSSITLTPEVLQRYRSNVFIETGTEFGGGIEVALAVGFEEIHSIELDEKKFLDAQERYAKDDRVYIYHGSSDQQLVEILKGLNEQATFWLDAHGDGQCPVLRELMAIQNHHIKNHHILIDDMRIFGTPAHENITIKDLSNALLRINPRYRITSEPSVCGPDDIMAATTLVPRYRKR